MQFGHREALVLLGFRSYRAVFQINFSFRVIFDQNKGQDAPSDCEKSTEVMRKTWERFEREIGEIWERKREIE